MFNAQLLAFIAETLDAHQKKFGAEVVLPAAEVLVICKREVDIHNEAASKQSPVKMADIPHTVFTPQQLTFIMSSVNTAILAFGNEVTFAAAQTLQACAKSLETYKEEAEKQKAAEAVGAAPTAQVPVPPAPGPQPTPLPVPAQA